MFYLHCLMGCFVYLGGIENPQRRRSETELVLPAPIYCTFFCHSVMLLSDINDGHAKLPEEGNIRTSHLRSEHPTLSKRMIPSKAPMERNFGLPSGYFSFAPFASALHKILASRFEEKVNRFSSREVLPLFTEALPARP